MAGLFRVGPWYISDALIMPQNLNEEYTLVVGSTYATIKNSTGQQLALSDNMGFAHNGLIYEVDKVSSPELDVHYVRTPVIETGYIARNRNYNISTNVPDTTSALIGVVIDDTDGEITLDVDPVGGSIFFRSASNFVLSVVDDSFQIDGVPQESPITIGTTTITGIPSNFVSALAMVRESSGLTLPDSPFDSGYNKIVIDVDSEEEVIPAVIATEEEVLFDSSLVFDDFGHGYSKVSNQPIYVSNIGGFTGDPDNPNYRDTDDHTFVIVSGSEFYEYNLTQIGSALNTDTNYIYDLLESTEKVYIGYQRPYTGYVLIDYYFSNQSVADGECASISDTATRTRAIRLKVYADKIVSQYPHADIAHIAPRSFTPDELAVIYPKLQYGAGAFFAPYKLYYYKDYGDRIKVIFNRETSSKYWTLEVFDQTTRWKAVLTSTNGTIINTLSTKYYSRSVTTGIWGIYPVTDPYVLINMRTKRAFDLVADTAETSFSNSAIDIDPKTIKLYTNIMYLNISNVVSSFPQLRLTYSTLAVIELAGFFTEIVFQAASGAIYGRYKNGTDYVYIEKDELLVQMNDIDVNYQFSLTCNISKLIYFDDSGNEQNIAFSDSTLVASEKISMGLMRVYYKNSNTNGFVIASSYEVQE